MILIVSLTQASSNDVKIVLTLQLNEPLDVHRLQMTEISLSDCTLGIHVPADLPFSERVSSSRKSYLLSSNNRCSAFVIMHDTPVG